jgi:hypothetical protein
VRQTRIRLYRSGSKKPKASLNRTSISCPADASETRASLDRQIFVSVLKRAGLLKNRSCVNVIFDATSPLSLSQTPSSRVLSFLTTLSLTPECRSSTNTAPLLNRVFLKGGPPFVYRHKPCDQLPRYRNGSRILVRLCRRLLIDRYKMRNLEPVDGNLARLNQDPLQPLVPLL